MANRKLSAQRPEECCSTDGCSSISMQLRVDVLLARLTPEHSHSPLLASRRYVLAKRRRRPSKPLCPLYVSDAKHEAIQHLARLNACCLPPTRRLEDARSDRQPQNKRLVVKADLICGKSRLAAEQKIVRELFAETMPWSSFTRAI